jgi:DNA-3-methyladenine glycosylase
MALSQPASRPLTARFFHRDTAAVARDLLGCRLTHAVPDGEPRSLVIVETEAYLGVIDRAAHSWNGRRTARVAPMWGPGGHAYVFKVYGLHDCFNVVARRAGDPQAVLVRAGVPEAWWRGEPVSPEELRRASGPGLFCRELGVTTRHSGLPLTGPELVLSSAPRRRFAVLVGTRIGVDYAGEHAAWPLRFAVAGCPAVTRRKTLRPV